MGRISMIDPERITERLFGGPHFRTLLAAGPGLVRCPATNKLWSLSDIDLGWLEGYNPDPLNENAA